MKKISLIVAIIILIKLCPTSQLLFSGEGSYTFYVGSASSQAQMITVDSSAARELRRSLKNVEGESLATTDIEIFAKTLSKYNAEFVFEENIGGVVCKYYYSESIKSYKMLNGKRVNIHTAENGALYTIGSPLIFGSF